MIQPLRVAPFIILVAGAICACEASPINGGKTTSGGDQAAVGNSADKQSVSKKPVNAVTNEQAPINQRFRSLDDYLAWLERTQGPVDGSWYKQVSPGIYELQTGNLRQDGASSEKQTFTREELARKFGFSH